MLQIVFDYCFKQETNFIILLEANIAREMVLTWKTSLG